MVKRHKKVSNPTTRTRRDVRRPPDGLVPVVMFIESPFAVAGQCNAECNVPTTNNTGDLWCQMTPACTACGGGCRCNLWATAAGTTNWTKVAKENVKIPIAVATWYRCWCTTSAAMRPQRAVVPCGSGYAQTLEAWTQFNRTLQATPVALVSKPCVVGAACLSLIVRLVFWAV